MPLTQALQSLGVMDIDPSRPLKLGDLELSADAAIEASRIIEQGEVEFSAQIRAHSVELPVYWNISHDSHGDGELFAFPPNSVGMPTAIEIGIVRALSSLHSDDYDKLLQGSHVVFLGARSTVSAFDKIFSCISAPLVGDSILCGKSASTQVRILDGAESLISTTAEACLRNSFKTAPIKFRFLEIYRIMEARFLADIKSRLDTHFNTEPSTALEDALDSLKSEIRQIIKLAEGRKEAFENCWSALDNIKENNRFAAVLFRKLKVRDKEYNGEKWKSGAALIYLMRCAIVHAGQKDVIFDSFEDGDDAISAILPHAERAALLCIGVQII